MNTENRRSFLRNLITGSAAVAVAKAAPAEPAPVKIVEKIVTVEKTVLKDIPNNVTQDEMAIWLTITARRRSEARAEKRKAQVDGRYFG